MAKEQNIRLTRFEREIMDVMWELGSASVRELQEQLPEEKRPAYTTVQTIVYRLEEKGAVRRVKKIGNAHIFEAVVSRKAVHRRLLDELLDFFGGSPRTLMAQLVESGKLTLDDVREVESALAELERGPSAKSDEAAKPDEAAASVSAGAKRTRKKGAEDRAPGERRERRGAK